MITLEMPEFYLVTVYTPNSQDELRRLDYRMTWEDEFRAYLLRLDAVKPVIVCGDLNVAHKEIDLKNPKTNRMNAGFTDQERGKFSDLLAAGFTDTFRYFYPDTEGVYDIRLRPLSRRTYPRHLTKLSHRISRSIGIFIFLPRWHRQMLLFTVTERTADIFRRVSYIDNFQKIRHFVCE